MSSEELREWGLWAAWGRGHPVQMSEEQGLEGAHCFRVTTRSRPWVGVSRSRFAAKEDDFPTSST